MNSGCEGVRERIAAGDALGDGDEAHLRGCDECRAAAAALDRVRTALAARTAVEPKPGFEARMTARALARMRGRRTATVALVGVVVAAAAVALAVWWPRKTERRIVAPTPVRDNRRPAGDAPVPPTPHPQEQAREAARYLLDLSDVNASLSFHASWDDVERPVADMKLLTPGLKGDER